MFPILYGIDDSPTSIQYKSDNHHECAVLHYYDVSFISIAVITLGFEQEVYFFSEQDLVANICVALLNGAVSRVVPFEVHTNLGNASGKELSLYDIECRLCVVKLV